MAVIIRPIAKNESDIRTYLRVNSGILIQNLRFKMPQAINNK